MDRRAFIRSILAVAAVAAIPIPPLNRSIRRQIEILERQIEQALLETMKRTRIPRTNEGIHLISDTIDREITKQLGEIE